MLYISRCIGETKYGVVDTDDGTETIVPIGVLASAVRNLKLEIKGAVFTDMPSFGDGEYVGSIFPQQPTETMTQLQVKTNLLHHVDIKVHQSTITSIRWRSDEITCPVKIRLSDFGEVLGDRVLNGNRPSVRYPVTLIFDNRVRLESCSLWRPASLETSRGLILDIRELTDSGRAMKVYRDWVFDIGSYQRVESVLDSIERKNRILRGT